jgi:hypothetical protein
MSILLSGAGVSKKGPPPPPTSTNATVQAWLNKIGIDGFAYPSQAKVDVYTTAFDYADAQGLTGQFDVLGLMQCENFNLTKVPLIHVGGAARRFTINNVADILFDPNLGVSNDDQAPSGTYNGYYNLNYNPIVDKVNITSSNVCFGYYGKERLYKGSTNGFVMGSQSNIPNTNVSRLTDAAGSPVGFSIAQSVTSSTYSGVPSWNNNSLLTAVRNNGTQSKLYVDGIIRSTQTKNVSNFFNGNFYFLTVNVNNTNTLQGFGNAYGSLVLICSGNIDQVNLNTFINLLLL